MSKVFSLFLSLVFISTSMAQSVDMEYYFPNATFNKKIPTPESVIRFVPGEWHVSHDKLVQYMYALAEASPRITIMEIGATYENRPLVNLIITTEENHQNLESLKEAHLSFAKGEKDVRLAEVPTVLYQGYSIHGNESSGANAAMLYAYYLAASDEALSYLENQVVIIDPAFNPDGLQRFSTWANMHKPEVPATDPSDREFNEAWPGGRTNHYWFDLNRDWLLLQHPESRARIKVFHEWKPNVLTDHHEMGSNSTFFFQPGIPSRTNPITPKRNQELTGEIGNYHAAELDKIGSQYYSQESFDDFYYGKGSTYPDANGCIGILFEQASSRGHNRMTANGLLTFPFTIRNQLATSLSTLKAGSGLHDQLLQYQKQFFEDAKKQGASSRVKGYLIEDDQDPARAKALLKILSQHKVDCYEVKGQSGSFFVPSDQLQHRLVRGIFEKQTSFQDSLFYDVSAWTLPLAFGLPFKEVTSNPGLGEKINLKEYGSASFSGESDYGYLLSWSDYYSPTAVNKLLQKGVRAKVCNREFAALVNGNEKDFPRGTIFIPIQNQKMDGNNLSKWLKKLASQYGLHIDGVDSGQTPRGIDLGSPNVESLRKPKILMLIGDGIRSYDAGEVWHLLDTRYEISCTKVESRQFNRVRLSDYNVIIIPDGSPSGINSKGVEALKRWVDDGGVIIGLQGAADWLKGQELAKLESLKSEDGEDLVKARPYDKAREDSGAKYIGGSIFNNDLDLTHPICYGYQRKSLPVFHQGTNFYGAPKNAYAAPLRYSKDPLLAGYVSDENLEKIAGTSAIVVSRQGRGRVITFGFNPTFRAFWWGTQKLLANAIFFGSTIDGNTAE
ncbi:MAG: zinc carboxypeptidase [Saprospiraceae bacterium]|nr:zinc carboxypeptidase [Saprospiraceae bacterium]